MKFISIRRQLPVLLCFAMVMSLVAMPTLGQAEAVEMDVGWVLPIDDALIYSKAPAVNYDTCSNCLGDENNAPKPNNIGLWNISTSGSDQKIAFLKFDVSTLSDSSYKYYLQVAAKQGSAKKDVTFNVLGYPDSDWSEQTITWEAPAKDISQASLIGTYTVATAAAAPYTVDITDYVRNHLSEGMVTLLITDSSTAGVSTDLYSKEAKAQNRPQLIAKRITSAEDAPAISSNDSQPPVSSLPVKEVNASSNDGNVESNLLDNNMFSRWSASGDGQFVDFDLGETKRVGYLGIAFYKGNERTTAIDIQTSLDAVTWTNQFSGNSSGANGNMEAFDILDTDARFVRIVGHGNSINTFTSITDVMIYEPYASGDTPVATVPNIVPLAPEGTLPFTKPGLTNPDGTAHAVHTPNPVTGRTINVTSFGADPADNNKDDRIAIQNAINAAQAGDEVYLPNGVYNLLSSPDGFVNLKLKTGVNFRGESQAGTILKSSIDDIKNSSVVKSSSQHDILVSNMTVSSTWDRTFTTEHSTNNPEAGGPDNGITVANTGETPSYNVTVDHVTVERFRRIGVRIENSHDVVVRYATFRNATDLGGGGAGYGTSIQGMPKVDRLGFANDTYWNLVEHSSFEGPYLRHGSLIQNVAHNNVLRMNKYIQTKLDSIDLHGELEYLNEVYGNEITNILTGGGIGLGNTGGTAPSNHSKSGPFNYIHDNVISNSREGIIVTMGTPDTIIENNIIENSTTINNGVGINILNGPRTIIRNNTIRNNTAPNYWGIMLEHDSGDKNAKNIGQGDPDKVEIWNNMIIGNTNGILLESGTNITVQDNLLDNLETNYSVTEGVTVTEDVTE
ncbi:DNRLRE domain-containing protein [Paenibacillus sp. LMG 31456]|uniref:DNRLRE domain-containing protein n=1 Tax=Paenibacillus foliorum TaxID=2654974 RepID=A0A972K3D0_9BACL|nr:DNRLRE domain-containing protein [Paenibacillus foliorum]NOU94807.1 DNRLRE domain-containing protein [Paenibacillus foliorum]